MQIKRGQICKYLQFARMYRMSYEEKILQKYVGTFFDFASPVLNSNIVQMELKLATKSFYLIKMSCCCSTVIWFSIKFVCAEDSVCRNPFTSWYCCKPVLLPVIILIYIKYHHPQYFPHIHSNSFSRLGFRYRPWHSTVDGTGIRSVRKPGVRSGLWSLT